MDSADVLIMAAGKGERFGDRKQFLKFGEATAVNIAVELFKKVEGISNIFVVYPPDMTEEEFMEEGKPGEDAIMVRGGILREESVKNGLEKVESDYVLIHDAARPACTEGLVRRVRDAAAEYGAAVPGINPASTINYIENGNIRILDRNRVYFIQTPQCYKTSEITTAYNDRKKNGYTDSSAVAREAGIEVKLVEGEARNIKITYRDDYQYLKEVLK
ncbi:IspD/TarI family cytidylyltransferase [Elusimicrobiota bacterium]